jgi:hypothetical protein
MSVLSLLCRLEYLLVAILRYSRFACLRVLEDVWFDYCECNKVLNCRIVQKAVLDGPSLPYV